MKPFLLSLHDNLLAIWRGLRVPGLYVVLLAAAVVWSAAYQQKAAYTVDVGGLLDDGYVHGFNAKEHNPQLDYRWSGPASTVLFPGIGNEPIYLSITTVGFRPSGDAPEITVQVRGQDFKLRTVASPHTDTIFVDRGERSEGDVALRILAPTFSPPGDARRLGVIVDKITVSPASYGLRPLLIPPLATLSAMLLGLVLAYLSVLATLRSTAAGVLVLAALAAIAALLVVASRPELGLLAPQLPVLGLWALGLGLIGRALLDALRLPGMVASLGSAAFAAAFVLRFGGTIYPQFLTSDIMLHVHNLQSVMHGQWLFTEPLPDGTPVPYPNALYLVQTPFAALIGTSDSALALLMKWSGCLFDSITCLGLAWAGAHLWGGRAGGLAALTYALSPGVFVLLSAGNYTNLFGQAAMNLTLLVAVVVLASRFEALRGPAGIAVLAVGFVLTMLGHYGIMLAALGVAGLFFVWTVWSSWRKEPTGASWAALGAFAGALVFSFAIYYWHFTTEMWAQWSGLAGRLVGSKPVPVVAGAGRESRPTNGLLDFIEKRAPLVGPLLGITAGVGSLLGLAGYSNTTRRMPPYAALLAAWLLAALLFAGLDKVVGDTIRWSFMATAPLALLAARFLAQLFSRGRMARILIALTLTSVLLSTLTYWVGELIFTRYH